MKETQKAIFDFHKKHQFPIHISLNINKKFDWLMMKFIVKMLLYLSKLAIWYWKITGTKNESFYRIHLIAEELSEMFAAINKGDLTKTADGLGDLLYVVIGTAVTYRPPAKEIIEEVCKSNETKKIRTKNNIRLRDKGRDWKPPDFFKAIIKGRGRLMEEGQI